MESKDDASLPTRDTKDEPAPPLAPTLKIVAKQFLARRAALGEAALDCDGIECLYGDFVDENADEFEGFGPADGSGNDNDELPLPTRKSAWPAVLNVNGAADRFAGGLKCI